MGADVALGGTIDDPYMVTIGAGAVLGNASLVSGNMVYGGKFVCGAVNIGAGATIGVNSVILPGTEVGENVTLLGGSYVMPGTKIPAGETWRQPRPQMDVTSPRCRLVTLRIAIGRTAHSDTLSGEMLCENAVHCPETRRRVTECWENLRCKPCTRVR